MIKKLLFCFGLLLIGSVLSAQITAYGQVTFGSSDGPPLPEWLVEFAITDGSFDAVTTTDENGFYEIGLDATVVINVPCRVSTFDLCTGLPLEVLIEPIAGQTEYEVNLILCEGIDPPPPPECEAYFVYEQIPGDTPGQVHFYDISWYEDITQVSWFWDFGDGQTSEDQNPVHIYEEAGVYDVLLTIAVGEECAATTFQSIVVYNENDCDCPTDEVDLVCVYSPTGVILTFQQPCLAECAGYTADEYFSCNNEGCDCPDFYAPVCVFSPEGEILFDNHCFAECAGYSPDDWEECNVNPCDCPEIYDPVCVDLPWGPDYQFDNACEAECAGFEPGDYLPCDGDCGCPDFYEPVCVTLDDGSVITYPNFCFALCDGYGEDQWVLCEDDCECPEDLYDPVCVATPGGLILTFVNPCEAECAGYGPDIYYHCEPEVCECPEYWDPVCVITDDGILTFSNPCFAACEGYEPGDYFHCDDDCGCDTEYAPVCVMTSFGIQTFSNSCLAECAGYSPEEFLDTCSEDCECDDVWDPVCVMTPIGVTITFSNICEAECAGFTEADFVNCSDDCICPQIYAPVCVLIDPTTGSVEQFTNACYAECAGFTEADFIECEEPCICDEVWDPVCVLLDNGVETSFQNACVAICEGYTAEDFVECTDCGCDDTILPACVFDPTTGEVIEFTNPCLAVCAGYSFLDILLCGDGNDCYADFTYSFDPSGSGLSVQLTDLSFLIDGATSWFWDFGDGQTSMEQNPMHTYAEDGVYDVVLTVESPDCGVINTVYHICVGEGGGTGADCQAFFFFEQPDADNLLLFQFIDFSLTGIGDTWIWDFGNGHTSTEQNPTHAYAEAGIYTVTLSVIDGDCNSTVSIVVNAGENYWYGDLACRAWFLPIITPATYEVFFINLSSVDAVEFLWDFGDGTTSTDPLAFHTYPGPGIYTVSLTTVSPDGCTNTFTTIINLTEGEGGFTSNPSFSLVSSNEEVVKLREVQVAPNPTRDQVQISWQPNTAGDYNWQLFDLNGRLIQQQQSRTDGTLETVKIDLSAQASGIYLFRLQTAEGQQTIRLSKL